MSLVGFSGGLPQWLSDKESACNVGDTVDVGSIQQSYTIISRKYNLKIYIYNMKAKMKIQLHMGFHFMRLP